jgi:F-type H+-transporting ATPase subunit gamma
MKDLKTRIASVKSTQQITKAMKMVSAAKLRRSQEAIQSHRPYANRLGIFIQNTMKASILPLHSPFLSVGGVDQATITTDKPKLLIVLVSSDRGLCGAYNASVIKTTQRWLEQNSSQYSHIELSFLGRKAYDFFKTKSVALGVNFTGIVGSVTFLKAKNVAEQLNKKFLDGEVTEIKFVYNEFKNAISQKLVVEDYLPLKVPERIELETESSIAMSLIKPEVQSVFNQALGKFFNIQIFRILLDAQASEHGARMAAMENASKNAAEMLGRLTLEYNKQRQASITKELLEIISGSESQKG